MITRGSTVTQSFALPFDVDQISEIFVTYVQSGKLILEKNKEDVFINKKENILKVFLSQDDTLLFHSDTKPFDIDESIVLIQIRALLKDNSSIVSNIMRARLYDVLKDGKIENDETIDLSEDSDISREDELDVNRQNEWSKKI